MDMPPIHMCVFLSHEYEQLKAKIVKLKNHISHLEQTIAEKNLDHSRSCSISCQTDIAVRHRPPQPVRSSFDEEAHLHRLLNAQNELLRKYEDEAVHNRQQRHFQSSPPSALIEDYERRLIRCQKEKEQVERRAASAQKRMTKLEGRYESMRQKMSVFDDGFFEEVNDLKFALQQATSLSREYEKTIQMLSAQLGITYPIEDS
jgi:predicted  nucleic acid-binding Zn-ribbon protein